MDIMQPQCQYSGYSVKKRIGDGNAADSGTVATLNDNAPNKENGANRAATRIYSRRIVYANCIDIYLLLAVRPSHAHVAWRDKHKKPGKGPKIAKIALCFFSECGGGTDSEISTRLISQAGRSVQYDDWGNACRSGNTTKMSQSSWTEVDHEERR